MCSDAHTTRFNKKTQRKRVTKEYPERRAGERNVDDGSQVHLEEDVIGNTRWRSVP